MLYDCEEGTSLLEAKKFNQENRSKIKLIN
jgi:hypothetical protein